MTNFFLLLIHPDSTTRNYDVKFLQSNIFFSCIENHSHKKSESLQSKSRLHIL